MPGPDQIPSPIESYLRQFVRRKRICALSEGMGVILSLALIWSLAACVIDRFFALPSGMRLILLLVVISGLLTGMFVALKLLVMRKINWLHAASQVEFDNPGFGQ